MYVLLLCCMINPRGSARKNPTCSWWYHFIKHKLLQKRNVVHIANGCSYLVQGVYCRFKGLWHLLGTEKKGAPKGTFIPTLGNQREGLKGSRPWVHWCERANDGDCVILSSNRRRCMGQPLFSRNMTNNEEGAWRLICSNTAVGREVSYPDHSKNVFDLLGEVSCADMGPRLRNTTTVPLRQRKVHPHGIFCG